MRKEQFRHGEKVLAFGVKFTKKKGTYVKEEYKDIFTVLKSRDKVFVNNGKYTVKLKNFSKGERVGGSFGMKNSNGKLNETFTIIGGGDIVREYKLKQIVL